MWFSLFATVLILAITFYQGLQGLFTALITCVLTILSAALAFGYYENIYYALLLDRQPDHGRAIALIGVFLVSLLVLRGIFDAVIASNMHFHIYADRIGGGFFGLITAMIVVGMLTIGFQLLPFPPSFLAFTRYQLVERDSRTPIPWTPEKKDDDPAALPARDWETVERVRQNTWINPDGFTVALVNHLSSNALRGREDVTFHELYPDFLAQAHFARANPLGRSRPTVDAGTISVSKYYDIQPREVMREEPAPPVKDSSGGQSKNMIRLRPAQPPETGQKYLAVRVSFDSKTRDSDSILRFTTDQVRLFGRTKAGEPLRIYTPRAINSPAKQAGAVFVRIFEGQAIWREGEAANVADLVFVVPEDFKPEFLEFKQNARADINASMYASKPAERPPALIEGKPVQRGARPRALPREDDAPPTPEEISGQTSVGTTATPSSTGGKPRIQDRVSGLGPARKAFFSDELPFRLTQYSAQDLEMTGTAIRGGRVTVQLSDDWQAPEGSERPIERFHVPQGKHLLQVDFEKLQPGSFLGRAMGMARDTVANYTIKLEGGGEVFPIAAFAIAELGGQNVFELIYLNEEAQAANRKPVLERIRPRDLQGDYAYYLVFPLPPGGKPVELNTGRQNVDLRSFNLQAPR
jgi:uncharacterized membrane protein required for colicin V production